MPRLMVQQNLGDDSMLSWLTDGALNVFSVIGIPKIYAATDPLLAGEDLTSTASGNGSITTADWQAVGGNCKPKNFTAMNYGKQLQQQLNRVGKAKGLGTIGVDGEIGPSTLNLFKKVQALSTNAIMGNASSCVFIAGDADVLADQVAAYANMIGAPPPSATDVAKAAAAGTIVSKSGKLVKPPGASAGVMDAFGAMGDAQKILMLGVLGGIGYLVVTKKSKKGASRTSRRSRR